MAATSPKPTRRTGSTQGGGGRPTRRGDNVSAYDTDSAYRRPKGSLRPSFIAAFLVLALAAVGAFALWRGYLASQPEEKEDKAPVIKRDPTVEEQVDMFLEEMSLEQKVAQLFVVTPESLTGVYTAVEAGDATREAVTAYPVGGLIYFAQNLESPTQAKELLWNTKVFVKDACGLTPFLCVDEEGGTVARVASNSAFGVQNVGNMSDFGEADDVEGARAAAYATGEYLTELGFNVNFAPVADIVQDPSSVMALRSFGSTPQKVSEFVLAQIDGYTRAGLVCCVKHFPGIGGAEGDSHNERIYTSRSVEQMTEWELVPFQSAVDAQAPMIMVGHLSCLAVNEDGGDLPASLSPQIVTDVLRKQMGYDGVIITDSMQMEAATSACAASEQGVMALKAGVDVVLMPEDFYAAYDGVMKAVQTGEITEDRIDESVRRIIRVKLHMAG